MTELPAIWNKLLPDLVDLLRKKKFTVDSGKDSKGYFLSFKKWGKTFYLRLTV